ncbi:MAG TPA: PaaI family thioesterase [Candidatus Limnocylindrales bacterium]|nr:PaaI family thioesterase [Candidatus Limnocylindrales bacterium]
MDPQTNRPGKTELEELVFPFGDGGCFGCSKLNPDGLQLRFFRGPSEIDGRDEIVGTCRVPDRFHGAPGITHGGIVATILDEFSCAAAVFLAGVRVVTGELQVRYERPCPVEREIVVRSRVASDAHARYLVIEAEMHLGAERLVRSSGKFFRQPASGAVVTP